MASPARPPAPSTGDASIEIATGSTTDATKKTTTEPTTEVAKENITEPTTVAPTEATTGTTTDTSAENAADETAQDLTEYPPATVPQILEVDEAFEDEGLSEHSASSYVSTIASDVRRGIEEHGHLYPAFRSTHLAVLPIDESELDRNDFQHLKLKMLQEGRLHLAPIGDQPQKILDLGTGTGIWAIDMADKYPSAVITGVDLAPVQPNWVPPNLQFELEDVEKEWLWAPGSFDYIHARELIFSIRDWPGLVQQAYDHLKPSGWLEMSATIALIESDDDTIPPGSYYKEIGRIGMEIGKAMGVPITCPMRWKDQMEAVGFEEVTEVVFKIPTNPWPKNKRLKQIGALEVTHFREGVSNLMVRAYTSFLNGDAQHLEVVMAGARKEVLNLKMHSYVRFHVTYGRKPGNPNPGL